MSIIKVKVILVQVNVLHKSITGSSYWIIVVGMIFCNCMKVTSMKFQSFLKRISYRNFFNADLSLIKFVIWSLQICHVYTSTCILFTGHKQTLLREKDVLVSAKTTKPKAKQSKGNMRDLTNRSKFKYYMNRSDRTSKEANEFSVFSFIWNWCLHAAVRENASLVYFTHSWRLLLSMFVFEQSNKC